MVSDMRMMDWRIVKLSKKQSSYLMALKQRFNECGLELHPDKTKIVYCKDGKRKEQYPNTEFDFLGYRFSQQLVKSRKNNKFFMNFGPSVSKSASKAMREKMRKSGLRSRTDFSLNEIAKIYNPILRGWINYYGRYNRSAMNPVLCTSTRRWLSGQRISINNLEAEHEKNIQISWKTFGKESRIYLFIGKWE